MKKQYSFYLESEVIDWLRGRAEKESRSLSHYLEMILRVIKKDNENANRDKQA